jgi:hypothetical protein
VTYPSDAVRGVSRWQARVTAHLLIMPLAYPPFALSD